MLIYILSRNTKLYSTKSLVAAVKNSGNRVRVIDYLQLSVEIMKDELKMHYKGKELEKPHAVIPRIGASHTFFGTSIVRHFEAMGVFVANGSLAITRSRDKLRAHQVLSKAGVDIPRTVFASNKSTVEDVLKLAGGTPLIAKIIEGTQGVGVVLIETPKAAKSVLDAFYGMNVNFLIQEFIEEAGGTDIRAFVIGGKVVGSIKRIGVEGDFRSNIHQGGTAEIYKLNKEEREMAIKAARATGLEVCGVDMIPSARGPLVMEVNSSPGLEGIETALGKSISDYIVSYIMRSLGSDKENPKKKPTDKIGV